MSDIDFNNTFSELMECFNSVNIEKFNEIYKNFEKILTPDEKVHVLNKDIDLSLKNENYEEAIKTCDKIIEIANYNELF